MTRGTVRRHVRIASPAEEIWAYVGNASRIAEWWPGITAAEVDGDKRTITTGSGIPMPEQILTVDRLQRRFQYRITGPLFTEHTSTIDVIDLDDGTCLLIYGIDADPNTMALIIGGAAGNALEHLKSLLEGS
jgi:uncharacterized protein YndB with AHSA1/START domain